MADIRSYMREKEKREKTQDGYQKKIRKHKLRNIYRMLLIIAVIIAVIVLVVVQYRRHIYTSYDVASTVVRENAAGMADRRLGKSILTYSKDGAHCLDLKGNVTWNQTYEIQDIQIALSGDTVAIGAYNGRNIYVQNEDKQLAQITTTMPMRGLTVSESGYVTAVLDDGDVSLIHTYNDKGELAFQGQARMNDSGYPASMSLSPNGELLCVSYWYVDSGVVKTNIAFYNLGPVGQNNSDFIVSAYSYTDMLVPQVQFMNNSTAFALGDSRLMVYKGEHKPVVEAERMIDEEIQSVFYDDKYIGLVFREKQGNSLYRVDVYDVQASLVGSFPLNIEYSDLFFGHNNFVAYNETECVITDLKGVEKFNGTFDRPIRLMVPAGDSYRYVLVTENSLDTIQLK